MTKSRADFSRIVDILGRNLEIDALSALIEAVKAGPSEAKIEQSAIIIDSSVILRISGHRKSSDIIDYLRAMHKKPVILPGQVVQEFWNNQLNVAGTVYKSISGKIGELDKEIERIMDYGVASASKIRDAIEEFKHDNEHIFDPELVKKTVSLLETLKACARVSFAPRKELHELAIQRKRAKTPPGFKDDGDGDFLVWADALWGLMQAQCEGSHFDSVILLTNDKKIDWCRGGTAHPILYAEIRAILGVHFEIWTLDRFADAVG